MNKGQKVLQPASARLQPWTCDRAIMSQCANPTHEWKRPRVRGKFLYLGSDKFYVRGVTYGAFPPNSRGDQFPEPPEVARDFALMREAGINTILTYTVPPLSLLDQAQENGLRAIIFTPWMGYVCFLEEAGTKKQMLREVRNGVAACHHHPAVLLYCVGKELPPHIVRWHGQRKVQAFLEDLCKAAKDEDPEGLVTYTNFPTTEYLELPFVDVYTFNVYLHNRPAFCSYLSRLQHLAGDLPLVLTEFGKCSFRHGTQDQAEFLDWQIEEVFDHGASGAVIFSWTDPFYQDNCLVTEWGFGLVDAERRPKPSYEAVRRHFTTAVPFPADRKWPRVSVVVAAHNAARTLEDCLSSLQRLNYPNYEVIVVNDGSTDKTGEIISRFPFKGITTGNQGVSAARNEGLRAASGDIVAYIDSDANADPDWLRCLATTYMKFPVAGVGGPNLVPAEDNWIAKCVYRAPGGPTQVMFDDQYAEHIPGCNMSFLKSALDKVGGFDPIFTAAADDVDICWRLIDKGYKIGFSPSALVWHHRRPTVRGYWRQQVGYGISESILERKTPNKFNPWGHTFWAGRIYAPYPSFRLLSQPVIYHGLWGSAPFQPMYDPGSGNLLTFLPRAMEWHAALAALTVLGVFFPWVLVVVGVGLLYTAGYCVSCAAHARLNGPAGGDDTLTWSERLRWRALIAWLHFLEPLARDWGRLKGGLTPWRTVFRAAGPKQRLTRWWQRVQPFRRVVRSTIPGTMALEKLCFLERLHRKLAAQGCAVGWNQPWNKWDLKFRRGALGKAHLRLVVEHHGGAKRQARLSTKIRPPRLFYWVSIVITIVALVAYAGRFVPAAVLLMVELAALWVAVIREANRLETVVLSASAAVAQELEAEAVAAIRRPSAQAPATAITGNHVTASGGSRR